MTKRIQLTAAEIDAILSVAGNADADATFHDCYETERERDKAAEAFESGMEKLRVMLSRKESK